VNCAEVEKREWIEKYLLGELGEVEAQELEEHYFSCDDCFEALKDASALRSVLAEEIWAVRTRRASTRQRRVWVWGVAAVVVLVGIGISLLPRLLEQADDADVEITRLAAIEAPPYAPRSLRSPGGEAERRFREAMARYQEGDYIGAIPGLETAAGLDSESAKIAFYLGACYLLTDQPVPAIESFGRVVELGRTPYLERARLYRAKAFLRVDNLDAAGKELEEVVRLGGELESDAQRILDRLPR
jgi:tetratricopeptide (TPR) repeat protein